MREIRTRFGDASVGGGVFQTEVGETGQTVIIWPRSSGAGDSAPRRAEGGGDGDGEGRLARNPLGKHTLELLRLAPFMTPPEPRQIGRVWELRWFDYPAGRSIDALPDFEEVVLNAGEGFPAVACWTVEVGPNADRVYLLGGYRDWDHRDEVTAGVAEWPPRGSVEALSGGARLLIPTAFSPFR
jgi:hypothetical protein